MKKIFVLTAESSGDKLASKVIFCLKKSHQNIEYLSVGGEHLGALNIKSIYDLKEVTYLGFTKVLLNIFKIKNKINETVSKIIDYNPNILFSVDSPDFTLRVAKKVKSLNPNIKIIHLVAPKVYVWRKDRIKKLKPFLDHILLLFPFEKKYFNNENINNTFVGHPLLEDIISNETDISHIIKKDKKIFSIFPGSRLSEINILIPILLDFIKLMNNKYKNILFVFHCTSTYQNLVHKSLMKSGIDNCEVISDEKVKSEVLRKSVFALAKSGTVSLEICNAKVPSIIIYKMNKINFFIVKMLVKVKYANIINIAADKEIIPELLQSKCNSKNIFLSVDKIFNDKKSIDDQINKTQEILSSFKTEKPSEIASSILFKYL